MIVQGVQDGWNLRALRSTNYDKERSEVAQGTES